ncbi:hypothetical protein H0H93_001165 [Arthromyces matolae]|nr:hypothetical protein H0H93_001165 [Arthromyces matolae]
MRPLTLHASALNNEEYDLYTASLRDLTDDEGGNAHDDRYYEGMEIGVREILRFFAPALSSNDVLTGGQFFAALRLVVHAEQGKDLDRNLGFVQAHPAPPKVAPSVPTVSPHSSHNPFAPRVPPLPPRKPAPPVPLAHSQKHPSNSQSILLPPPRKSISPTRPALPPPPPHHPPVPPKPTHVTSTLIRQSLQATKAAQTMKRAETQLEKERVLQVLKSSAVVSGGYTLAGAHIERSSVVVGTSVRTTQHNHHENGGPMRNRELSSSQSSNESLEGRAPPLPRRRTINQQQPSPPVSVSSIEQVALAKAPDESAHAPLAGTSAFSSHSPRPSTNPFPVANTHTNNPYRRPSTSSYKSFVASPQGSPTRGTADLPPPTHPDRLTQSTSFNTPNTSASAASPASTPAMNDSEGSPTTRVFRSKSLHHSSPPPQHPLPSAPPRRRPESVQVLAGMLEKDNFMTSSLSRNPSLSNLALNRGPHKRQTSLSSSFASLGLDREKEKQERDLEEKEKDRESPLGKFARSWQPRLERARYKAEAGLSRRGYVRDRSRSKGPEDTEDLLHTDPFGGTSSKFGRAYAGQDYDPPSVDGSAYASSGNSPSPHRGIERDGMKWPVAEGEGWRPL